MSTFSVHSLISGTSIKFVITEVQQLVKSIPLLTHSLKLIIVYVQLTEPVYRLVEGMHAIH